jgi:hypothetical protein
MKNSTEVMKLESLSTMLLLVALAAVPSFAQPREQFHSWPNTQAPERVVPEPRRPEPEPESRPQYRRPEPEPEERRPQPQPENRPEYRPRNGAPEDRPGNFQPERSPNLGSSHPNTSVIRPAVITPTMRHAMTYNTRSGGVHINPAYFETHYGYAHGFHFTNYAGGACVGDCGLKAFGGEWYFNCNGGWFGIMGPMPGNWAFQSDYLYIGIGDDGNYYLYDAQFPDAAVQLTFVQNIGDDQAGADGDQSAQQQ